MLRFAARRMLAARFSAYRKSSGRNASARGSPLRNAAEKADTTASPYLPFHSVSAFFTSAAKK